MNNEMEDAALSSLLGARTSWVGDRRSNKSRPQHCRAALTPPPWVPMGVGKDKSRLHELFPSVSMITTMIGL